MYKRVYDILVNRERRFLLFWNPRCASTSLAKWFAATVGEPEKPLMRVWMREKGCYLTIDVGDWPELEVRSFRGFEKAIFIRNPYGRLVSVFLHKFVIGYGGVWLDVFDKLENFSKKVAREILGHNGKNVEGYSGVTFRQFVEYIERTAVDRNYQLDHHFTPQLDGRIDFDFIGRTETLEADLKAFQERCGLPECPLPWMNAVERSGTLAANRGSLCDRTANELMNCGALMDVHAFLDDEMAERIRALYAVDFELGGYGWEIPGLHL